MDFKGQTMKADKKIIEFKTLPQPLDLLSDFKEYIKIRREDLSNAWEEDMREYHRWFDNNYGYNDLWDDYFDDDDYETIYPSAAYGYSKKSPNTSKKLASQRFINGIEVDSSYDHNRMIKSFKNKKINRHTKTRCNHNTKYEHEMWDEMHQMPDDLYDDYSSHKPDEDKKIVFYRSLKNEDDIYTFDSALQFSDWLTENCIDIEDSDGLFILDNFETHCCLDPSTSSLILRCGSTYEDLVWEVTGGDYDYLNEISEKTCPV